jgi:hypothetical protein
MLKRTFEYEDYEGNKIKQDEYFHLSEAELTEMTLSEKGGLDKLLQKIVDAKDTTEIIKVFKEVICKSYGELAPDGKSFRKTDEKGNPLYLNFIATPMYDQLFMELATNDEAGANFINGIMPKKVSEEMKKTAMNNTANVLASV